MGGAPPEICDPPQDQVNINLWTTGWVARSTVWSRIRVGRLGAWLTTMRRGTARAVAGRAAGRPGVKFANARACARAV